MNTIVNKVSLLAVGLAISVAIGVAITGQRVLNTKATGTNIYDYYSQTNSSLAASVSVKSNWVLTDSNAPTNKFTYSIGSNSRSGSVNTVWLGDTSSAVLTGTSAGQFVYGSPNLKSLATNTNLTSNSKLYGFRMNTDIDLTNYKDVTVTIGWLTGGSGSTFTGFIAKSLAGSSEAWSLLTPGKQSVVASSAGSLSFTDTGNTVLQGQSKARFALILGSTSTRQVLKNIYITITANLRTTLDSINNPLYNHVGNLVVGETMNFHELYFTANYSYRPAGSTATVYADAATVTLSLNSDFSNPLVNGTVIPVPAGTYTLYYKYYDPTIDPSGLLPKANSMTIVVDPETLTETGIYMTDAVNYTSSPLYKYDIYQPSLSVYPLYNSETTPRANQQPFGAAEYTTTLASGTMLTASTNNIATDTNALTSSLAVTVNAREATGIVLTGQKIAFLTGDAFSFDTLVVTGNWSAGNATHPSFASSQTDGKYTVSLAAGTVFLTAGTHTITVSYYVNGANVTATYDITFSLTTYTFFNHSFTDGTEWGATTSFVNGAVTSRDGTLTNYAAGWTASTTWVLNTMADNASGPNGAFGANTNENGDLLFLRFGTSATTNGPKSVSFEGKNFPAITNPENTLNGISRMTVDADTGVAGSLTVSVAGIAPTSYSINYGTPTSGSTATTLTNSYTYYTFYFPYMVIGKIKVSYTNGAPQPGYFDLGNFSVIGQNLTLAEQTGVFANMLNNANSCTALSYTNLLPVYNYLAGNGGNTGLTSITMTNHGSISASSLWSILVTRYSGMGAVPSTPETLVNDHQQLTIILISLLGITAMGAYFFFNKKKADRQQ